MDPFARLAAAKMKDMQAHLEKLRTDAAECAMISGLATDKEKCELFARLSAHLTALANEVEGVMRAAKQEAVSDILKVEPLILCPDCKLEMRLFGVESENAIRDLYSFECTRCGRIEGRGVLVAMPCLPLK